MIYCVSMFLKLIKFIILHLLMRFRVENKSIIFCIISNEGISVMVFNFWVVSTKDINGI